MSFTLQRSDVEMGLKSNDPIKSSRNRHILGHFKTQAPLLFIVAFFVVYNLNVATVAIPLASVAGFGLFSVLYYQELSFFLIKNRTILLYPLIILLSATWSPTPSTTLWYGLQLCITICTGILIGITATPRQLARGIFASMAAVVVASLIWGRLGNSANGLVLVGVTGGKTAMGYAAVTLVGSGMAVLFDRQQPLIYRLATLPLLPIGAYIANHVEAASAKVLIMALPLSFFGFLALRYVTLVGRWALVALMLTITVPFSAAVYTEFFRDADQMILRALNKDATLTGRTMMWDKADTWIKESPEIGYGYRAFWTAESSDSIGILHHFFLTDSRGFQLHNTVREILVDVGALGLAAFFITTLIFLYYTLAFVFLYPSPSSAFVATMYLMMLARTPIETVVVIFYPGTALFYACGTAAIVFFMNQSQGSNYKRVADPVQLTRLTLFRRRGRIGRLSNNI